MKKLFVFAFADAAMVGCNSENGEGTNVPGQSDELRVLTSVSTQTRTAVDGTGFPKGSYIGVQVTQKNDDTQLLSGGAGNGTYLYYSNGKNIRFGNEAGANNWASIDGDNKTHLFILEGTSIGKVRGYYPYTAALEGVGADDDTGAKIPVQIQKTGDIIAVDEPGQGTLNGPDSKFAATSENEIDYMFDATTTDNGNNEVSAASTTTAKLVLKHALSRVSFRMYASAEAQQAVKGDANSYYEFVGYTIKNKSGATEFCANYDENTKMKIFDGKLEGVLSGGEIARTITGYKLVKSEIDNEIGNKAAADASLRVSNLVFPHKTITAEDNGTASKNIEVVFQLARVKGDGTKSESFGYALPFAIIAGQSDTWEAGKNYTYTVKFTGNALSIETVTVTDWVEVVGGDMEIE